LCGDKCKTEGSGGRRVEPSTPLHLFGEEAMEEPEQTIMRTSLSRPQQLLGGDRELVIVSGLGAGLMAVSVMTFLSFLIAFLSFGAIVAVLARIGKVDPIMRKVYSRHLQYKDFYPAKSGVTSLGKTPKRSWR
jgi:type IV secretion system protein VirB3